MTRYQLAFSIALLGLSGCMLNRSALGCPSGSMYEPGGLVCIPVSGDADGSMTDGGLLPDGDILADAGIDADVPDGDSGPLPDAWIDPDGGSDGGRDSGPDPVDAGPPRRCEDTTTGICIRVDGVALIDDWAAQFNWTRPGGSLHTINWVAGRIDCAGGIRVIDADTTECEIVIPDPGTPVIDTGLAYVYPERVGGISPCMLTFCPAYHAGWRLWIRGTEYPTDPATPGGRCGLENPTCLDGTHAALRINLP